MIDKEIKFSSGHFNIISDDPNQIYGNFVFYDDSLWHFERRDFKIINLFEPNNMNNIKSTLGSNGVNIDDIFALGYFFGYTEFKLKYNPSLYPNFSSFILNHKTNRSSGRGNLSNEHKTQDLILITDFFAKYLEITKLWDKLSDYDIITWVPPAPERISEGFINTCIMAENFQYSLKLELKRLISRPNSDRQYEYNHNENIEGKNVIIAEDVITSGGTINSISTLLKSQGCKNVGVISLGRTLWEHEYKNYL